MHKPQPVLPEDVYFIICEALLEQRDFDTLFCCCIASRSLAVPAITSLWRASPVTSGAVEDAPQRIGGDPVGSWAKLWRSLIRSCLGLTMFPYCRYIRILDFHDLENLFDDPKFRTDHHKTFFTGTLAEYRIELDGPPPAKQPKSRAKRPVRLDSLTIVRRLADLLTTHATNVQELAGKLDAESLIEWIPRLHNLQSLRLWDGANTKGVAPVLRSHCPNFRSLTFYQTASDQADACLSAFIEGLPPNTLQSYMVPSNSTAETAVFSAFNHHANSLTSLRLDDLSGEGLVNMAAMSSCTALKSLKIRVRTPPPMEYADLQSPQPLANFTSWLCSCKSLTEIDIDSGYNSDEFFLKILTPFLLDPEIHLSRLSLENYYCSTPDIGLSPGLAFYAAITSQAATLQALWLRTESEFSDIDAFIMQLGYLQNLKVLNLRDTSDYFQDRHVVNVVNSMPLLEDLWVSGWELTDVIWDALAGLRYLRRLDIQARSQFSVEGIANFIRQLNPDTQRGFLLNIMAAGRGGGLIDSEETREYLRHEIFAKVEGRFELTFGRTRYIDRDGGDTSSTSDSDSDMDADYRG